MTGESFVEAEGGRERESEGKAEMVTNKEGIIVRNVTCASSLDPE